MSSSQLDHLQQAQVWTLTYDPKNYQFHAKILLLTGIPWIGVFFSNLIIHKDKDGPCQSLALILLFDIIPLLSVNKISSFHTELILVSGLLCVRCPGLQWPCGGTDQQSDGQSQVWSISQDQQLQVSTREWLKYRQVGEICDILGKRLSLFKKLRFY